MLSTFRNLHKRQAEVLRARVLDADGRQPAEIAKLMGLTASKVAAHLGHGERPEFHAAVKGLRAGRTVEQVASASRLRRDAVAAVAEQLKAEDRLTRGEAPRKASPERGEALNRQPLPRGEPVGDSRAPPAVEHSTAPMPAPVARAKAR